MYIISCFNQPHDVESKSYIFLFFLLVGSAEYSDSDGQFMLRFDLGMVLAATDEFSSENTLGQGGFGTVYKVVLTFVLLIMSSWLILIFGE